MFLPLLPTQVPLCLSFGVILSLEAHPAHKGNKGSSLLQRQIKTNMDPKGQKGDNCTELAMITLSHCSRRIEQHNPNLNAWCLALLFPSEANKKIKVKRPEVSGECGHANKIFIEPKINLA